MDPTCSIVLNDRVLLFHYEAFGRVHFSAAAALFAGLGYASIYFFTGTSTAERGSRKRRRDTIYRACGVAIWAAIATYGLFLAARELTPWATWVVELDRRPFLFFVETVCLWAFGLSWLVKGDGVYGLSDRRKQGASQ